MLVEVRAEAHKLLDAVLNLRHSVEAFILPLHTGVTHTLGAVPSLLTFVYFFADIPDIVHLKHWRFSILPRAYMLILREYNSEALFEYLLSGLPRFSINEDCSS